MLQHLSHEDVEAILRQFAATVTAPVELDEDPAIVLRGADVVVRRAELRRVADRLGEHGSSHAQSHQLLACTLLEIGTSSVLALEPGLGARADRELVASAALMAAEVQAKRGGLTLLRRVSLDEFVEVLTKQGLSPRDRRSRVQSLCRRAEQFVRDAGRPLPTLDRPNVYVATPISGVSQDLHSEAMVDAERVGSIIEEYGWRPYIPGRYIRPDRASGADFQKRDETANGALNYSSCFVAVRADLGARGMGYAVRRAEDNGAPVLTLSREPKAFARVYGASVTCRHEEQYETPMEVERLVREFCDSHVDQIRAVHADLTEVAAIRDDLRLVRHRVELLDEAAFRSRRLSRERALFLTNEPVHIVHAQVWEFRELESLLGMPAGDLSDIVRRLPPQGNQVTPLS